MPSWKSCCPAAAARRVKKIKIGNDPVGIDMLDQIMEEVMGQKPDSEERIKEELITRVKIHNYVPRSEENEYKNALFLEYKKRVSKISDKSPGERGQ